MISQFQFSFEIFLSIEIVEFEEFDFKFFQSSLLLFFQ